MTKSKVAVIPCCDYDEENVYNAVKSGIDILGGIGSFVSKSEKILVKPNFLSPAEPETAVTTHPAVTGAIFRILHEEGYAHISYGDSPGRGACEAAAEKSGTDLYAARYGIEAADMKNEVLVSNPEGKRAKFFHLCRGVHEADAIINVCKMKTHQLEKITGAVKNVYGYICGPRKAAGHVSFPNASAFARMLCDIHRYKAPRLNIMDGITAMEGNGPGSGTPTPMNLILISTDPVAIDSLFARLIYLDPRLVPTCLQGELSGTGYFQDDKIEILLSEDPGSGRYRTISTDELVGKFGKADFDVDREGTKLRLLSTLSAVMTRFTKRPVIDEKLCVRCGICVSHCPVPEKAVDFDSPAHDRPPIYNYRKCIRCYCCQEMCPQKAIHT